MFGIGIPELIILLVIAAIIIGPIVVVAVVLINVHGKKKTKTYPVKIQSPPLPKLNDIDQNGLFKVEDCELENPFGPDKTKVHDKSNK